MAGTNRNRKMPLNEAWKHYWSVLFPTGDDWQIDLETEVRKHLYFPGEIDVFQSAGNLERSPPPWAVDLELSIEDGSVSITFKKIDFGKVPLFMDQLIPVLNNGKATIHSRKLSNSRP